MRVLVTGAHGFLGSHIAAALAAAGHDVVAAGRDLKFARRVLPQFDWVACDFNRDTSPDVWLPRLAGVEAVVNCVGVLQATRRDRLQRIHVDTAVALMRACERAGVRRFVQLSALGIETATTEYARTKRAGDEALAATSLDWVVVRASLVVGRGSYGGTSLMRGLAGLPGLIPLMGGGEFHWFQPILMCDFTRAIVDMVGHGAPSRTIVPVAGPTQITLKELILTLRQWLGFGSARVIAIPGSLFSLAARVSDALGWIGVPTAFRTTSLEQMEAGSSVADGDEAKRLPLDAKPLRDGLFAEPATVEDRWHARLYFLKPLLRIVLGGYWLAHGLQFGVLFARDYIALFSALLPYKAGETLSFGLAIAEPLIQIVVGLCFLLRVWLRPAALLMLTYLTFMFVIQTGLAWVFGSVVSFWLTGLSELLLFATIILVVLAIERER
jgi:uncharacterized protein YbjT (DUF2867 family)